MDNQEKIKLKIRNLFQTEEEIHQEKVEKAQELRATDEDRKKENIKRTESGLPQGEAKLSMKDEEKKK